MYVVETSYRYISYEALDGSSTVPAEGTSPDKYRQVSALRHSNQVSRALLYVELIITAISLFRNNVVPSHEKQPVYLARSKGYREGACGGLSAPCSVSDPLALVPGYLFPFPLLEVGWSTRVFPGTWYVLCYEKCSDRDSGSRGKIKR